MSHRLFIAIKISEETKKEILSLQREYSDLFRRSTNGRWLYGHNLHITLIPPWYEDDTEKVKSVLKTLENKNIINSFDAVTFNSHSRRI